jgi:hypothetical protein
MVTMAIMVILMAIITMIMDITIVTGIIVIMVQGMDPVIGDETKGRGDNL